MVNYVRNTWEWVKGRLDLVEERCNPARFLACCALLAGWTSFVRYMLDGGFEFGEVFIVIVLIWLLIAAGFCMPIRLVRCTLYAVATWIYIMMLLFFKL